MLRCVVLMCLIVAVNCDISVAQRRRERQRNQDSTNERQDVEGMVWEYKVIDNNETDRSKQTKMTGRLRIKQSAIFAVGKASGQNVESEPEKSAPKQGRGAGLRGQRQGRFSQRSRNAPNQQTSGDRVGDLSKSTSKEKTLQFDEDDDYPLSGIVVVQPDADRKNGVWLGRYDEFSDGKKKKRWRFEMRKIDE